MVKIKITDLETIETDSFISTINNIDAGLISGGKNSNSNFPELVKFAIKMMEFVLLAYAMDSVGNLATSFNNDNKK